MNTTKKVKWKSLNGLNVTRHGGSMEVTVQGKGSIDFKNKLITAAKFYGYELLNKKMADNIVVDIVLNPRLDAYGYCDGMSREYNERWFEIELKPVENKAIVFCTLAHEMVHLKQMAKRELVNERWKGKMYRNTNSTYWTLPWEKEAQEQEEILFKQFIEQYRLQNYFGDYTLE
jgi:hypothetical protein